jgi:lipopolysaccharide export LptBFGC system permease protein LptF
MFYDLAPILVPVTTLITFGLLARSNEVTAAKALGVSLFRLGVPALVAAAAVAVLCSFLQAQVLPAANEKIARLEAKIRGEHSAAHPRADQWLFGQGSTSTTTAVDKGLELLRRRFSSSTIASA